MLSDSEKSGSVQNPRRFLRVHDGSDYPSQIVDQLLSSRVNKRAALLAISIGAAVEATSPVPLNGWTLISILGNTAIQPVLNLAANTLQNLDSNEQIVIDSTGQHPPIPLASKLLGEVCLTEAARYAAFTAAAIAIPISLGVPVHVTTPFIAYFAAVSSWYLEAGYKLNNEIWTAHTKPPSNDRVIDAVEAPSSAVGLSRQTLQIGHAYKQARLIPA